MSACFSVCLSISELCNGTSEIHEIFGMLPIRPWLDRPSPAALRYVMYFRFCGRRIASLHVMARNREHERTHDPTRGAVIESEVCCLRLPCCMLVRACERSVSGKISAHRSYLAGWAEKVGPQALDCLWPTDSSSVKF